MTPTSVLELLLGDVVRLRRVHPCGGRDWLVDRLGADIGIACQTCGRRVLVNRRQLEARIVGFVRRGDPAASAAVSAAALVSGRPRGDVPDGGDG